MNETTGMCEEVSSKIMSRQNTISDDKLEEAYAIAAGACLKKEDYVKTTQENGITTIFRYFSFLITRVSPYIAGTVFREGRGAMARAQSLANFTTCRAVSNPAWCGIIREISCLSPLNIGTLFRCCVLGQDTLPSHASLDSGVNEYLVRQRWQCVRIVPSAEMAASAVCFKKGVEIVHE